MTWYTTGTISVTNGSPTVYGTGTLWVDTGTLNAGDITLIGSSLYQVQSIQSNTQLTLSSNFLGTTASGASYAIIPIGLLPSALAQQVKTTLASASSALTSAVLNTPGQAMTTTQQLNARQNIAALGAADVGQGYVSLSVAGNTNVALSSTQAQASIINLTGTLTGNINVSTSMTPRLYIVENATTGAFTVTFIGTSGSGVTIPQGGKSLLMCDGTNITAASTPWTGLTSVPTAITSYAETMDQTVATSSSPVFAGLSVNGTFRSSIGSVATISTIAGFETADATNPQQLTIINQFALGIAIQPIHANVSYNNTYLNPYGGRVLVNTTTDDGVNALQVNGSAVVSTTLKTGGYTVATLPTGSSGMRTYVTDATAPTFLGALTGGGSVVSPVFYNGTAWVAG